MSAPEPWAEAAQRFALIELDAVVLLLPQHEVRAIEPVLDVNGAAAQGAVAGEIRLRGGTWPVLCPSDDLQPLAQLPAQRRIVAMLYTGERLFGLVCRNVASVLAQEVTRVALPDCMRSGEMVTELGIHAARIVCLTDAARLWAGLLDRPRLRTGAAHAVALA